jgi:hypothetical protein
MTARRVPQPCWTAGEFRRGETAMTAAFVDALVELTRRAAPDDDRRIMLPTGLARTDEIVRVVNALLRVRVMS